jgi:hypothetical protein
MLATAGVPVGALIGGGLADAISVRAALLCMAAGALTGACYGCLSPLRRTDRAALARLTAEAESRSGAGRRSRRGGY